jgi:tetratricopeptide (TPR) repeat protein
MRHLVFIFLLISCPCFAKELTLDTELLPSLVAMNNGHLLEAYSDLKNYTEENPENVEGLFLLALAKWKIMWISTFNKTDRAEFTGLLDEVERLTEPQIEEDIDAHFFYTGVQGMRAQLEATENEWWSTAQLGKKMKHNAELIVDKDSDYHEAYYLLGSFNYFADALPSYIKFLRTFMFLPGGDRTGGLKQLIRAYEEGHLVAAEAGRTLAIIYTYYEKIPKYGIQMCDNLLVRYPDSYDVRLYKGINLYYSSEFRDAEVWLKQLRTKIDEYSRVHGGTEDKVVPVYMPMEREVRYWIARSLIQQKKYDEAKELLEELVDPPTHQPWWIMRGVSLSLAQIHFIQKEPEEAEVLIEQILKWSEVKDSHEKAELLRKKKDNIGKFEIDFY